jgi:RNase P/RNase MRP subunit p29
MGGVVLAGGVALAVLYRGPPPILGQPRATAEGKDVLHLVCEQKSCQDGTVVALGSVKTTFMNGEADLQLASALHVGDNALELKVDRPGMGRDETVKLTVPVAYRVSADVTTMSSPHPAITVRVEAKPGAQVTVDGKPLALDPGGAGSYAVDEQAATEGAADESRVVSVDVPYTVATPGHGPEKGSVSARVAVAPLRVDSPGTRAIVDEDKVLVAGRAAKGASVTVDGAAVTVGPDGAFETLVPLPAPGDRTIDVRGEVHGAAGTLMPRAVHVSVSRVGSLGDAAKDFEQQKPLGYDAVMADIVGKTGQPIVVDGAVIESRGSGHRTLALVDDKRGCAKSPCLTRVIVFRDTPLNRGDALRAYGTVARGFKTPAGQTIPEVDSLFVQRTGK